MNNYIGFRRDANSFVSQAPWNTKHQLNWIGKYKQPVTKYKTDQNSDKQIVLKSVSDSWTLTLPITLAIFFCMYVVYGGRGIPPKSPIAANVSLGYSVAPTWKHICENRNRNKILTSSIHLLPWVVFDRSTFHLCGFSCYNWTLESYLSH